ncbi:MAG: Fic family protein [Bdellovibrionaceae bacterium]|nr:Fic family protein [Pseudobdellovibrionaceae bacterium]
MDPKATFEFLNSPYWLKYTQQQYRTPEEIHHRLKDRMSAKEWEEIQKTIVVNRKTNAIPLFLNSIDKKFWFFPSDSILKKADELEKSGTKLHQLIVENSSFKDEFFMDSLIEEAITSALYEGANSTRAKAQELIESGDHPRSKDDWMLLNNYEAMKWIKQNRSADVTIDLVKKIHAIVSKNTLEGDDANFSGLFRNDTVYVRSSANEIKHEGIPYHLIDETLLEALELTTKHPRYFPKIIKGILLHYFIAYIHPFFDGNGRTARALFYFKVMKNGLSFVELLSVSAYLKNHGRQYEKSFEKVVGNEHDLTYFIDFNLDALLEAIKEVERKVEYLLSIKKLKGLFAISDNQIGLLQRLALNRFRKISIEDYAGQIGKSREIARQELKQLGEWGLVIEEKTGKKFVYQVDREALDRQILT